MSGIHPSENIQDSKDKTKKEEINSTSEGCIP